VKLALEPADQNETGNLGGTLVGRDVADTEASRPICAETLNLLDPAGSGHRQSVCEAPDDVAGHKVCQVACVRQSGFTQKKSVA